jgi:hypothetical protein
MSPLRAILSRVAAGGHKAAGVVGGRGQGQEWVRLRRRVVCALLAVRHDGSPNDGSPLCAMTAVGTRLSVVSSERGSPLYALTAGG